MTRAELPEDSGDLADWVLYIGGPYDQHSLIRLMGCTRAYAIKRALERARGEWDGERKYIYEVGLYRIADEVDVEALLNAELAAKKAVQDERDAEANEERERAEYARLHAKFGGGK